MPEHLVDSLCEREHGREHVLVWHRGQVYLAAWASQIEHEVVGWVLGPATLVSSSALMVVERDIVKACTDFNFLVALRVHHALSLRTYRSLIELFLHHYSNEHNLLLEYGLLLSSCERSWT